MKNTYEKPHIIIKKYSIKNCVNNTSANVLKQYGNDFGTGKLNS